jgi:hypothetical protein
MQRGKVSWLHNPNLNQNLNLYASTSDRLSRVPRPKHPSWNQRLVPLIFQQYKLLKAHLCLLCTLTHSLTLAVNLPQGALALAKILNLNLQIHCKRTSAHVSGMSADVCKGWRSG